MPLYGTSHLVVLAVTAAGLLLVARPAPSRISRAAGVLLGAVGVGSTAYDVATRFEVGVSLPLHLSDLAWMAGSYALVTRSRLAAALTYYWGLTLTLQAVLTPSLGEEFPDVRFVAFWLIHAGTLWAAVHLAFGMRLFPRWREYRLAVAVTMVWLVVVLGFNAVADTNYGYLLRKPAGGSAFDLLGPWPVYLLATVAILAVVWALLTWPWARRTSNSPFDALTRPNSGG